MFFIDSVMELVFSLTSLVNEITISGLHFVGIANIDISLPPIIFILVNLLFIITLNRATFQQKISNLITIITTIIWVIIFITISDDMETFLYPRIGLMSIAINAGLQFLPNMVNNNPMMLNLLKMTMSGSMIISVFGYPTMSVSDSVVTYLCLIPLVISNLSFFISVKEEDHDGETIVNGTAVMVKDSPQDLSKGANEHVQEAVNYVVDAAMDVIEDVSGWDKVDKDVDEGVQDVEESVNNQVPITDILGDNNSAEVTNEEPIVDSESVDSIGEVSETGTVVEDGETENEDNNTIIEEHALVQKLNVSLTTMTDTRIAMSTSLICIMEPMISLPWISILLMIMTTMSQISIGLAWCHLTSSPLPFLIALPNFPGQLGKVQPLVVAGVTLATISK